MTCIIVMGVPRSGTSAVAGFLHQFLGVHMGDRLMGPMPGVNPRGFFEDMEFVEKHIEILGSHEDPRLPESGTLPCPERALEEYAALIRRREQQHALWGVKDPKMCFLLPYFLRRLTTPYKIVTTHRPFVASVESMRPLYGGMTLDQAILRVGRYKHAMEINLRELEEVEPCFPRKVVHYDLLMKQGPPGEESTRAYATATVWGLMGLADVSWKKVPRDSLRRMTSWFDPSLCHHGGPRSCPP